ncbi:TetR/AcrR family transcriptional regulator [Hydrogenobaculum acidophilum]
MHKTTEEKVPQRESTKDKIIEIAAEIIAQEGLRGFTAKNIAAKLNITDAAIFKHFKDMNDLVQAVVKKYTGDCLTAIRTIIFDKELSIQQKIDKIMDTHIDMLEKAKGQYLFCVLKYRAQIYTTTGPW